MAMSFRIVLLLAIVLVVSGAFTCSAGFKDKVGTPTCTGAVSSTCSLATCCDVVPTCKSFSVAWGVMQLAGGGCAADTKFFDNKKPTVEVGGAAGTAEVKAACCTPFADAKCSDWLKTCPGGKSIVSSNGAPADGNDGKSLTQTKYDELCCVATPSTCLDFSVAWGILQLAGGGCAADTKFFDNKKPTVEVAEPKGESEVKAACCTPFADAKCNDWLNTCPGGKSIVSSNGAPADGSDGKSLTQTKYDELCCVATPSTCSDFSVAWGILQLAGGGCAADTKFFDNKKPTVEVAEPKGESEVKATCCTPFADAKCSDWLMTCPVGQSIVSSNGAPADGSDGKSLTQTKYNELCCMVPMKCADFTEDASSATSFSFAVWGVAALVVAS